MQQILPWLFQASGQPISSLECIAPAPNTVLHPTQVIFSSFVFQSPCCILKHCPKPKLFTSTTNNSGRMATRRLMIHATHFMKFHALEQFHQIPSRSVIYTDEKCKFIILHLNNSTGGAPFAAEFSASLIAYRLLPGYQNQMK